MDTENASSEEQEDKKEIIRMRILAKLSQPTMTITKLELIENVLEDICRLADLNQLLGSKSLSELRLFPKIDPSKFDYTSKKNKMVCENCVNFTLPEALEGVKGMAKVCDECVCGSAYHPF